MKTRRAKRNKLLMDIEHVEFEILKFKSDLFDKEACLISEVASPRANKHEELIKLYKVSIAELESKIKICKSEIALWESKLLELDYKRKWRVK